MKRGKEVNEWMTIRITKKWLYEHIYIHIFFFRKAFYFLLYLFDIQTILQVTIHKKKSAMAGIGKMK